MRRAVFLVLLLSLAVLVLACDDDAAPEPTPTPSPSASPEATASLVETPTPLPPETPTVQPQTPPAATPSPSPVACAAGSTNEFMDAQATSDFAMYCPTLLPAGLTLAELRFTPPDAASPPDPAPGQCITGGRASHFSVLGLSGPRAGDFAPLFEV